VAWWAVDLWANPPAQAPAPPPQAKYGLKVFKLSFTDPLEMKAVLEQVLELARQAGNPMLGGVPVTGGQALGNIGNPPVNQFLGGGVNNFMGGVGVIGGQALGNIGNPSAGFHLAVAPRIQAVLLRAGERELKICTDVVTVLDTAPGKPLPKVKNIGVFPLKHAEADQVKALAEELGFPLLSLPAAKLVIAPDVASLDELETVIRELDVPARPALPPEKRKKLLNEPPAEG
jgi:hypothetical protein